MSTFIIRNKSTLQQWVADSGKSSWNKASDAKSAWKRSRLNVPIELQFKKYIMAPTHVPLKFDDQDVYEIVELYSDAEKRSAEIERKFKEILETFYGQNLYVANWHLNGDLESMDNFFEENDWFIEN